MKKLVEQMAAGSEQKEGKAGGDVDQAEGKATNDDKVLGRIAVDQYMFLFLKFISSVIPTIEYDYTRSI